MVETVKDILDDFKKGKNHTGKIINYMEDYSDLDGPVKLVSTKSILRNDYEVIAIKQYSETGDEKIKIPKGFSINIGCKDISSSIFRTLLINSNLYNKVDNQLFSDKEDVEFFSNIETRRSTIGKILYKFKKLWTN